MSILRTAVMAKDVSFIRGWLMGRLMLNIPEERVVAWVEDLHYRLETFKGYTGEWGDGSIDLFFRAQMTKENLFESGNNYPPEIWLPVELHIGFVQLYESEEMLEQLRRPDPSKVRTGPDTPGIERTQTVLTPIDSVAAKVVR